MTHFYAFLACFLAMTVHIAVAQNSPGIVGQTTTYQSAPVENPPAGTLTIYVYPPSDAIDYKSPASALWSILRIEAKRLLLSPQRLEFINHLGQQASMQLPYRSTIGHTLTCISCILPDTTPYLNWVSLSSHHYTDTAFHLLVRKKRGLAFLFHNYTDGTLIRGDENILRLVNYTGRRTPRLHPRRKRIQPRYMAFHLTEDQCLAIKEMVEFYTELSQQSSISTSAHPASSDPQILYFSNMIDPYLSYLARKQTKEGIVGGGCAPFGVGLLKASGHHLPTYDQIWKRTFRISENLIGTPDIRIPAIALLFGKLGQKWVHTGHPVRSFDVYDPEMIWEFIGSLHDHLSGPTAEQLSQASTDQIKQWMDIQGLKIYIGQETTLFKPTVPSDMEHHQSYAAPNCLEKPKRSIQGVFITARDQNQFVVPSDSFIHEVK